MQDPWPPPSSPISRARGRCPCTARGERSDRGVVLRCTRRWGRASPFPFRLSAISWHSRGGREYNWSRVWPGQCRLPCLWARALTALSLSEPKVFGKFLTETDVKDRFQSCLKTSPRGGSYLKLKMDWGRVRVWGPNQEELAEPCG